MDQLETTAQLVRLLVASTTTDGKLKVLSALRRALRNLKEAHFDQLSDAGIIELLLMILRKETTVPVSEGSCEMAVMGLCDVLRESLKGCSSLATTEVLHQSGAMLVATFANVLLENKSKSIRKSAEAMLLQTQTMPVSFPFVIHGDILAQTCRVMIQRRGRASCIALALLSGWTRTVESSIFVCSYPGMVESVLGLVLRTSVERTDTQSAFREASILFRNLACESRNRPHLIAERRFFRAMDAMLRQSSETVTNSNVLTTVSLLSSDMAARTQISRCGNSSLFQAVYRSMTIEEVRPLAADVLLKLVQQPGADSLVKYCPGLLHNMWSLTSDVRTEEAATQALQSLSQSIGCCHRSHPRFLDTVLMLIESSKSNLRCAGVKALLNQTQEPTNTFYLVRTGNILHTVARLADDKCAQVRSIATETLLSFAEDTLSVRCLTTNTAVMEVVVKNAKEARQHPRLAKTAVQFILRLTSQKHSMKRLAKQFGLVSSLSMYCTLESADTHLKRESLYRVRSLVPHM